MKIENLNIIIQRSLVFFFQFFVKVDVEVHVFVLCDKKVPQIYDTFLKLPNCGTKKLRLLLYSS